MFAFAQIICSENDQISKESNKFSAGSNSFQQYAEKNQSPEQKDIAAKNRIAKAIEQIPVEKIEKAATIATAGVVVTGAACSAGKTIWNYWHPTEEQILHQECVKFQLKKIKAQQAIKECMVRNRKTEKNADNIPYVCQELFEEFVTVATEQELEETKRLVNLR